MLFSENVTFIIPIFRLKSDRIRNLKCIVPYILNTECKILIVEQAKDELSDLSNIIPVHENIKHLLYTSNSEIFHKSGIINWAVKNHVDTKYIWVNDVDFYMKFDKVLSEDWNSDFIKPYISGKKLSADDTKKIIDGEKLNVSYEDESAQYISLYGALSFIFEKNAFLNIGGMDETIFGWGKEDVELSARIKNLKIDVQEMDFKGIHLWHPVNNGFEVSENVTSNNILQINKYFNKVYCVNLDRRPDRWISVNDRLKKNGIEAFRFSAIDGEFLNREDNQIVIKNKDKKEQDAIISTGAMGCLLSHLDVLKDAKANNYKRILILEDDVYVSNDFEKRITDAQNIQWKLLYLGASQFNWDCVDTSTNFYQSKNTFGTFAYAVDMSLYDELIEEYYKKEKPVDVVLSDIQKKYYGSCYTFYPNIMVADVGDSDIRDSVNMKEYAKQVRWDMRKFSIPKNKNKKKKILLVPDTYDWAFANIAKAIVKYNPCPDKIKYSIVYVKDILEEKITVDTSEWDLIYVMFEAETIIPDGKNVIRGCYSAFWLEYPQFSPEKLGKSFSNCKGAVFVNPELKRQVMPFLPDKFPTSVIYDSSDENMFYPVDGIKNKEFTVVFVGNPARKIKNFSDIEYICKRAKVKLEVCEKVPSKYLVYEYNKADVCINFSTFEGGPQTFAESSLCGTPMLIRNTNELSKLIPCFTGETKEDFVDALKFLKNNRDVCKQRGKEARQFVINNFTYRDTAEKFAKFFLKLKNN